MIPFDLLLAFILALVAWGLIRLARAIRALAMAVEAQTAILTDLAEDLEDATLTREE